MITVLLDKAEFEYDIHSLVKAFYPKEEVYVSTKDKEKKEEPVHYHMDVQFAPEEIIFSWKKVEPSEENENQTGIISCCQNIPEWNFRGEILPVSARPRFRWHF